VRSDWKNLSAAPEPSRGLSLRVRLIGVAFFFALGAVLSRAVYLQWHENGKLQVMAEEQYVRELEIPAKRGDVFDRRGTALAQSVEVDSIWVDPSMLTDLHAAANALSKRLSIDASELLGRLHRGRRFVWVKRQVTPHELQKVQALGLPGIGVFKEPKRFYPQRELAAQLLGRVGLDGQGLEGLEQAFDSEMSGHRSVLPGFRDAKGRKLLTEGIDVKERQGASVTLTLDRHLQYVTEKALGVAVEEAKGLSGIAIALDPTTGEILALANYPRFNPNVPLVGSPFALRNRGTLDAFEPGSTVKVLAIAGALEEGVIQPEQTFNCENGAWNIGRSVVHDTHPHGWLNAAGIIQVSSNIGAAKIGQLLGRDRLGDYYRAFGLGEHSGVGLPGESKGNVPYPKADIALATQSFGQGLSATALQMASAYATLANGGVRMRPYLVAKVVDPDGAVLLENGPTVVRRVVSEKTAHTLIGMMEGVVAKEGTAPRAKMEEYRVAGKTGTAQKVDPVARGYSDKRIASFIGIVPAEAPRLVIAVVVDEPKTDVYGGLVAAPAFKEIAQAAMPYLGVAAAAKVAAKSPAPIPAQATAQVTAHASAAHAVQEMQPVESVVTTLVAEGDVQVPDLKGHGGRDAVSRLLSATLAPRVVGSGLVVSQQPPAGTRVVRGAQVTVELAARP
jgi:cell division protein FtsI (penicillin-binding protein 3)